jgi:hypothetical protein
VYLTLEESGPIATRLWTVFPQGTLGFDQHDEGIKADFANREEGQYVFFVSVASEDGSVSHDQFVLTQAPNAVTVQVAHEPAAEPEARQPQPQRTRASMVSGESGPTKIVRQLTREVESANFNAERKQVITGLRTAANAINSGSIRGGDLLAQTRALIALNLKEGALPRWQAWLDGVEDLFNKLQHQNAAGENVENIQESVIGTPAKFAAALQSTARILESTDR